MQAQRHAARLITLVRRRPAWGGAIVALVVLTAVLIAVLLPGNRSAPRADNVSRNFRACLLDSPTSTTDAPLARATWQGMRTAAGSDKVNAERFATPTTDPKAALPYVNGAVQHHCGLIVAVGTGMRAATEAAAKTNPHQRFVLVGATSSHSHIQTVPASDGDPSAVADKVEELISAQL